MNAIRFRTILEAIAHAKYRASQNNELIFVYDDDRKTYVRNESEGIPPESTKVAIVWPDGLIEYQDGQ